MNERRPVPPPRPSWHRRLLVGAVTLLAVLLPALLAARGLAAPGDAAELARLQRAVAGTGPAAGSAVALRFYGIAVPRAAWPETVEQQQTLLVAARTAAIAAVLALAMLTYLLVLLARGRLHALVACLLLGLLPAVAGRGYILLPEAPATLLAALAVLLLQCLSQRPRRRSRRAALHVGGLVACAALASGLAVATLPRDAAPLLVAGVVLTLLALELSLRGLRLVRRRGWPSLPIQALNARLLPWTVAALLTPAMALWLLRYDGEAVVAPWPAAASCWPATAGMRAAFIALLVVGGLAIALRAGQRWRRVGRPAPDLVLLVYAVLALAGGLPGARGGDGLPVAAPIAALAAEGVLVLARLGWRWLSS